MAKVANALKEDIWELQWVRETQWIQDRINEGKFPEAIAGIHRAKAILQYVLKLEEENKQLKQHKEEPQVRALRLTEVREVFIKIFGEPENYIGGTQEWVTKFSIFTLGWTISLKENE